MYYNLRRVFKTSAESLEKIHEDDIPRTIIKRKKNLTILKIYVVCFIWWGLA